MTTCTMSRKQAGRIALALRQLDNKKVLVQDGNGLAIQTVPYVLEGAVRDEIAQHQHVYDLVERSNTADNLDEEINVPVISLDASSVSGLPISILAWLRPCIYFEDFDLGPMVDVDGPIEKLRDLVSPLYSLESTPEIVHLGPGEPPLLWSAPTTFSVETKFRIALNIFMCEMWKDPVSLYPLDRRELTAQPRIPLATIQALRILWEQDASTDAAGN